MTLLKDDSEYTKRQWINKEKEKKKKRLLGHGFTSVKDRPDESRETRKLLNRLPDDSSIKEKEDILLDYFKSLEGGKMDIDKLKKEIDIIYEGRSVEEKADLDDLSNITDLIVQYLREKD
jgi:hypothetical protein